MLGDNLSRKTHYLLPALLVSVHLLIILCLFSFSVPPLTSDKLFVDQKSAKRIQYKLPNGIWIIPDAKPNLLKSKAFNALKGKVFENLHFSISQCFRSNAKQYLAEQVETVRIISGVRTRCRNSL